MPILVGTDTNGVTAQAENYIFGCQFTASATGTSATFRVYSTASGNIKVAIYSDSSGDPGTRLGHNSDGTAVTGSQWNQITLSGVSISASTVYWLLVNADTSGCSSRASSSGGQNRVRLSQTYSGYTFPETAPVGWTDDTYTAALSVYSADGWTHISKFNGIASASISKVNGVAVASISKINGIAV